jgi:TRAP-type mannitol/chloroaromatic compound transport system permease large subunit
MMGLLLFESISRTLFDRPHIWVVEMAQFTMAAYYLLGGVATVFALLLWGKGGAEMPFNASFALLNWYPLLTLPLFVYMGYMFSRSGIASDLYRMFHVWMGPVEGGLAIGTMGLMVAVSAMNGLSVAGMAIGASIAMPEMLKRDYDKVMVTGVIQAGSSLGIMVPPSVVLVLYGMIARQPVGQLWMAGVFPGLLLAALFIAYIAIRCKLQPAMGPALSLQERQSITWGERMRLLKAGILPLVIIFSMTGLFLMGIISLGYNPIWYGVLYTITCQIAYMTPPFGYNLFLMKAMAPPEVSLADIYRSIVPFVLVMILGLAIVMAFPQIALWLPNLFFGR